jgi:hypothetical protein
VTAQPPSAKEHTVKNVVMLGLIVLAFCASAYGREADPDGYTPEELKAKVTRYHNLRTGGFALLGGGGALVVTGLIMMSSAKWYGYSTTGAVGMSTHDAQGGVGALMLLGGLPCGIAGSVLSIIGSKKYREYRERAGFLSGYDPGTKTVSAVLVYNF